MPSKAPLTGEFARDVMASILRVPRSRRERAMLRELPLRPERLAPQDLKLSCAFSLEVLNRLDELEVERAHLTVIPRARRILAHADLVLGAKPLGQLQAQASGALAKAYSRRAETWRAAWHEALTGQSPNVRFVPVNLKRAHFQDAEKLLFQGEPYLAWQQLSSRSFERLSEAERVALAELRFLCYVLMSPLAEVRAALRETSSERFPVPPSARLYGFAWLLARDDETWFDDPSLWRIFQKLPLDDFGLHTLVDALKNENSRTQKLDALEEFFTAGQNTSHPEQRLLILGVVATQLRRLRAEPLQAFVENLYRQLSSHLSGDETRDLWNLLGADEGSLVSRPVKWSTPPPKIGARVAASMSLSFALAQIMGPKRMVRLLGGQLALHQLTTVETERMFDAVAAYLSRLKGPLLKLGQTASYTQMGLPPLLAERFQGLQSQADPLPPDVVMENWREWKNWLIEIDPSPLGVGSIGQVHRARLKSSREEVAIKVRFPDIEQAVQSDFRILRSLLSVFSLRAPKMPLGLYLRELEQQITKECDFQLEANAIARFGKRFADDPHVAIPRVYSEFCNSGLLVTELMRGQTLAQLTSGTPQAQRDLWGKTLVRFVVSSCRDADFNTDPHPGNFLFTGDRVACLDFGSTCQMSPSFSRAWNLLIISCVRNDFAIYLAALKQAEMNVTPQEAEQGFRDLIYRVPGCWTFPGQQALAADVIAAQIQALSSNGGNANHVPPAFIFGLRVYFGHLSVVAKLGAQADWNAMVGEIMQNECLKFSV